jgi:hypothetical protein
MKTLRHWTLTVVSAAMFFVLFLSASPVHSQQQPPSTPTTAPLTPPPDSPVKPQQEKQQKKNDRIFGVMPNYATVEGAETITPISSKEKFKLVAEGAFDPYEFAIVGLVAATDQASDADAPFGQGLKGYAKRYGADFANQAIGNFMVGAVVPSIIHQDPRYFQLGKGRFGHRFYYALSRIVVARTDSGHKQFNYSEFVGNAAAAGIANVYIPATDRTLSNTASTWATQIAIDAFGNELKEFWPDIRRRIFRHKSEVQPQP